MKQYLVISMYGMSLYDEAMQVHDVILRNSEEISIKAAMEYVTYYSKNNRPRWAVMALNVLDGKVVFSKAHNPPIKKRTTLNEKPNTTRQVSRKVYKVELFDNLLDSDEVVQQPGPLPEHLNPLYWANALGAQANQPVPQPHPENEW